LEESPRADEGRPQVDFVSTENAEHKTGLNLSIHSEEDEKVRLLKEFIERKNHKYNILIEQVGEETGSHSRLQRIFANINKALKNYMTAKNSSSEFSLQK